VKLIIRQIGEVGELGKKGEILVEFKTELELGLKQSVLPMTGLDTPVHLHACPVHG
jgi:hypothetical protein